ncbi:MAG: DUF4234 domain-containing protein [Candidatus Pacearchaeota archaeon]
MGKRTIIDYLIEGKQRGFSDEVLKDDLMDNGFDEQVIDGAFYQLHFQMNLQSRNKAREVRDSSDWADEFDEDSSQQMPEHPSNGEKKPTNVRKKKDSGYNQGAIEGIKHRGWGLVLLFTMITFGIYGLVWLIKTTRELRNNTDSAPSPHWLWSIIAMPVGAVMGGGGFITSFLGFGTGSSGLAASGGALMFIGLGLMAFYLIVMIYYNVFYALAINELSGFSKAGTIALWILLPIVAIPVSQVQLNKFADDD